MKAVAGFRAWLGGGPILSTFLALLAVTLVSPGCAVGEASSPRSATGQDVSKVDAIPQRAPALAAEPEPVVPSAQQVSQSDATPRPARKELKKLQAIVEEMEPGVWLELADTRIPLVTEEEHDRSIAESGAPGFWGWTGSSSVVTAWNSAAYDPEGQQWYFFGGGHADYGGNEVYSFDLVELEWSRLTSPSPLTGESYVEEERNCPTPASGPPSVHTYDGLAWNPETRSVWLLGLDSTFCVQDYGTAPRAYWEFDPQTREWRSYPTDRLMSAPATAWMPSKKRFFVMEMLGGGSRLEVDGKGENHRIYDDGGWWEDATATYDPKREVIYIPQREEIRSISLGLSEGRAFNLPIDLHNRNQSGWVYHPPSDRFVIWSGLRAVFTWDPKDNSYQRYDNLNGTAAPKGGAERAVYEKIIYIPELDVFAAYNNPRQGVWLYRLPRDPGAPVEDKPRACVNENCSFHSIRAAFEAAEDGTTVRILPGRYQEAAILHANGVTVQADGAHIYDAAAQGKAALVIKGNNTIVEGLECSNVTVSSGNGACIRLEGKNLTLRRVFSHHNQMGMLASSGTGLVRIEESRFEDNGIPGGALGHNLYIESEELEFIRSKSLRASNEGHELKSRAGRTLIEDSVLASLDAEDSRVIDIPNGGKVTIQNNVIQQGPNTSNSDVIGIGLERGRDNGTDHTENEVVVRGNTILLDRNLPLDVLNVRDVEGLEFSGNKVVGGSPLGQGDNTWFFDRRAAGLPDYPALPD